MKVLFVTLSLAVYCCRSPAISLADLESAFSRPEYIANNDGWAEGRRRTLLKKFLQAQNISYRESTSVLRGKYNRVTVHAGGKSGKAIVVTLALPAGPGVAVAQARCDRILFAQLRKKLVAVDFAMTDNCVVSG